MKFSILPREDIRLPFLFNTLAHLPARDTTKASVYVCVTQIRVCFVTTTRSAKKNVCGKSALGLKEKTRSIVQSSFSSDLTVYHAQLQ